MFRILKRFMTRDDGSLSVEAVIILPVIFTVFMGTYTYFDAYRAQSRALKANYAISDLLSRDDNVVAAELQGAGKLFRYLTHTGTESWVGVTVIRCKKNCDKPTRKLVVAWSKDMDLKKHLTTTKLRASYLDKIPSMYNGEYLIMVETRAAYKPPFGGEWTGIYPTTLYDLVVTKPRGSPKVCYENEDCNI